ncbi:polycystic kidney disease 2-like 2 protein [Chrysoperla carnea]|uniref:polycystic kidney disease 2-like 2 protein n=1 Tax=Chrysoperla carnea TaxID=189513 RepID=UPI001D076F46|nr:polycystic kidney disease 2-like 2 protein [Chrysoperla carnea]
MADESENQDESKDKMEVDDSSLTSTDESFSIESDKPSYKEKPTQRSYLSKILEEGPWLDLRVKKKDPIIYLMGILELRQVRIQDETCEIDERIQNSTGLIKCFGEFELKYEETHDVPIKDLEINDQQISDNYDLPFKYQEQNPNIPLYQGKFATYPPGGYVLTLPRAHWAQKAAVDKLLFLKRNNWLNRKTRAVFLDAVIYCPNTNLMSSVKLVFEVSPAGGVTALLYVRTAQIFLFVNASDYINLACIVFLTICVVYFIVEEVRELFYFKLDYFYYFSSVIDLGLIFLEEYSSLYNTCITLIRYFMFLGDYRLLWQHNPLVERNLLFKMYTLDLKQTVNANELPLLISNIIKTQVEDYEKHATAKESEDKQKLLMERDDEYTPKLGVEVIATELNRLETYMDKLEEQVEALDCHFFERNR